MDIGVWRRESAPARRRICPGLASHACVLAPFSSRSAWCSSPARSARVLYLGAQARSAGRGVGGAGGACRDGALQHRQQPPARPQRARRPDRRSVARHRRSGPPGRRRLRAGSARSKAVSTTPSTGRAARSIRSPPKSANWARWCARSPRRSPATQPSCSSRAPRRRLPPRSMPTIDAAADGALTLSESDAVGSRRFRSLSREAIVELIGKAVDANRIDLYLQPIVTLPQRKVRYYEALSRLRTDDGDVVPAGDFIEAAESGGLMPQDRQPAAVPLRAGGAPPAAEEPRRRPVLQCQRRDAERCRPSSSNSSISWTPTARSRRADARIHARAPIAPSGRSSTKAWRRWPSAASASRWITSPTCAWSRKELAERGVPLPQGAGQAAAQSRGQRAERHPSRRSRRPAWRAPAST